MIGLWWIVSPRRSGVITVALRFRHRYLLREYVLRDNDCLFMNPPCARIIPVSVFEVGMCSDALIR